VTITPKLEDNEIKFDVLNNQSTDQFKF